MATATFVEDVAARDLTISDDSEWTTPATEVLPNGDNATQPNGTGSDAEIGDGSGDFAVPFGVSDFTVEFWVYYHDDNNGVAHWLMSRNGNSAMRDWEVINNGASRATKFRVLGSDGLNPAAEVAITADLDAWTYCVFTFNSSLGIAPVAGREAKAYKNTTLVDTDSVGSGVTMTRPTLASPAFTLGSWGSTGSMTDVEIAKLAIYHRLLTSGELTDHYDAMTT